MYVDYEIIFYVHALDPDPEQIYVSNHATATREQKRARLGAGQNPGYGTVRKTNENGLFWADSETGV